MLHDNCNYKKKEIVLSHFPSQLRKCLGLPIKSKDFLIKMNVVCNVVDLALLSNLLLILII